MHALPSQVLYISENWLSWRQFDLASLQCSPGKAMISLTIMSMISLLFKTQHLETMWQYFRKQMTWKKLMAWLTSSLSSGLETALCTLCIPQALVSPCPNLEALLHLLQYLAQLEVLHRMLGPVGASWGEMEVQFVVDFVDLMLPCDWNGKMKQSRTTSHYRSRYGSHYEPVLGHHPNQMPNKFNPGNKNG